MLYESCGKLQDREISVTVEMKVSPIYLCPTCGTAVAPRNQRFCSACGVRLNVLAQATTVTRPPPTAVRRFSDVVNDARFPPGAVLAQRYRIVSLLGRGGMGEVYRGDDLLLRQPVALKFLPAYATASEPALSRFLDEVRIARQLSHPNVCRVYDIGEAEGLTFITMEYVDGEDSLVC